LERAGRREIRMDDNAREVFWRELAGISVHGDKAKAVEGEMRLVDFVASSSENVLIGLLRGAEIFDIEIAVLVQYLGMTKCDFCSGRTLHLQAHASHEVLTQVGNAEASRRLENLHRRDFLDAAHGKACR